MIGAPARLAVVGDHDPRYESHQAIDRVLASLPPGLEGRWHASDDLVPEAMDEADAVWIAPGSPYRDRDAVLGVIRRARERDQPLLATCGGFQHVVLEVARDVAGLDDAEHGEDAPDAETLVVVPLACSLVGEVRPVTPVPGTRLAAICGPGPFDGVHYCSYGLAPEHEATVVAAGLVVAAHAPDADVEALELPDHRFFVASLFQPQMSPRLDGREHPLLEAFLHAALAGAAGSGPDPHRASARGEA